MSVESIIVIFIALAVGSIGKAITGFGLPLIAIPVAAAFIDVETAVVVMVIPSSLTNLWLLWEHRASAGKIDRFWPMLAAGVCGIVLGTWLLSELNENVLSLLMAFWIAVYLLNLSFRGGIRLPVHLARHLSPPVNFVAGIFQGATGIAGPIIVTYLHALRLAPGHHVFVVSAIFLSFGAAQVTSMATLDLFSLDRLWLSLMALIPVVLTMPLGLRLGRVIDRKAFDATVIVLLIGTGGKLVWNGIAGLLAG